KLLQNHQKELGALFMETIEKHLQSDVPYGVFLSGGVDSSAVVAGVAERTDRATTYSIGFSDPSVADERVNASRVARMWNTHHHEYAFNEEDFWGYLPAM